MKRVPGWLWASFGLVVVAYVSFGFTPLAARVNGNDFYNVASLTACGAAILFIATYTVAGFLGYGKWWRNDVGSLLVLAVAATLPTSGLIAWAVLFHHGLVNTVQLAWILIGGTCLQAMMILGLDWIWIRSRFGSNGSKTAEEPASEQPAT